MIKDNVNFIFDNKRIRLLKQNMPLSVFKANPYNDLIEKEIINRLAFIKRDFKRILVYGDFLGSLVKALQERFRNIEQIASANIVLPSHFPRHDIPQIVCYEEQLPFLNHTFDLAISCGSFHHLNDISLALQEYRRVLQPDGLFLASFAGGNTLYEAREALLKAEIELTGGASPRIIPMVDLQAASELIQRAGFSLPVVDRERYDFRYSSLKELLLDLKQSGESNYMSERVSKIPPRNLFPMADLLYRKLYLDEQQRLKASLELIHLCGWAPGDLQPKSCLRGSAHISLTEVFNS